MDLLNNKVSKVHPPRIHFKLNDPLTSRMHGALASINKRKTSRSCNELGTRFTCFIKNNFYYSLYQLIEKNLVSVYLVPCYSFNPIDV